MGEPGGCEEGPIYQRGYNNSSDRGTVCHSLVCFISPLFYHLSICAVGADPSPNEVWPLLYCETPGSVDKKELNEIGFS